MAKASKLGNRKYRCEGCGHIFKAIVMQARPFQCDDFICKERSEKERSAARTTPNKPRQANKQSIGIDFTGRW